MRYKKMVIEWECDDGEEDFEIIIVPDHVTALQAMTEEHDCICNCYTDAGADLIVKLLNRHYSEH